MQAYTIRKAVTEDLDDMMQLFEEAKQIMRKDGNMEQWTGGYPEVELIKTEISKGNSYIIETAEKKSVATFAFITTPDPTYTNIYNGEWEDNTLPYGTIHRLASKAEYKGIAETCFNWCYAKIPNVRVDTHKDNHIMQHVVLKNGFEYCGIIHLASGDDRLAYQKIEKNKRVSETLKQYIDKCIIPQYENFDKAHQRQHVDKVIKESMKLSLYYPVNGNMVYATAAYHDTGLIVDRATHHIVSARIIREDQKLRQWFSEDEINIIADAAEDHRASAKNEPRTIYGRIVSEADRSIDTIDILTRTIQYGLKNYPEKSEDEQIERAWAHLQEKYAEGGYLKLWIKESENAVKLKELQQLLKDKKETTKLLINILREETNR